MVNFVENELVEKVQAMKKLQDEIMEYCTSECARCPIEKMCDWEKQIDLLHKEAEKPEVWKRFVQFAHEHDEKEKEKQFKDATGYDPMAWDMLTRGMD